MRDGTMISHTEELRWQAFLVRRQDPGADVAALNTFMLQQIVAYRAAHPDYSPYDPFEHNLTRPRSLCQTCIRRLSSRDLAVAYEESLL